MSEASEVADFLLSDESYITYALGKLDFTFAGFPVDLAGYREIGHKIRQGALEVKPDPSAPGARIAASYTALANRLSVPAGLDLHTPGPHRIANQSVIVHEVTHALVDFHRFTTTGALDEACAYLAGQLYAMSFGLRQASTNSRANAIFVAAQAIVTQRRMTSTRGTVLFGSDPDVVTLARAVRGHTHAYPDADITRTGDGISGGLLDPWYLPRN